MLKLDNKTQCPECGRFANRGTTIDAIIVKDSKILLIKRGVEPYKGYWGLCGGYVEWDETVEGAVRREVEEELHLHVESLDFIGFYSKPDRHPKQAIDFAFAAQVTGDPVVGDDALEFQFFDFDSLPKELAFDHKQIINDYRKKLNL
jgi:ADP-ribose pyrophosphatase YjhB (NUDIX family)